MLRIVECRTVIQLTWNDEEKHLVSRVQLTGAKSEQLCGGSAAVDEVRLWFIPPVGHHGVHLISSE